ncbi:MAG: DUF3820 family protein [Verrucomicrobiales bacterium]|nr:DUF3820 family protein [Verrucomicrobiales bacterium]
MSDQNPFLHEDSKVDLNPGDIGQSLQQDLADYFDDLLTWRMPFGRNQGAYLDNLPYEYLHWFIEKGGGFPAGRLGELMEFVYHTKAVGAEVVFAELKARRSSGGVAAKRPEKNDHLI